MLNNQRVISKPSADMEDMEKRESQSAQDVNICIHFVVSACSCFSLSICPSLKLDDGQHMSFFWEDDGFNHLLQFQFSVTSKPVSPDVQHLLTNG